MRTTDPSTTLPEPEKEKRERYKKKILDDVKEELKRVRNYIPKVGIFGDTGVGKSSLCNALFGKDIAKISNVEACTREPQEIFIGDTNKGGIILVDVPGTGEDPERHQEYIKLYESLTPELDLVLWTIKADDRKYASGIDVYKKILKPNIKNCPVVFVITQVDKIEPYRDWDLANNHPGSEQEKNIQLKINDISDKFDISTNKIIPISANDSYNLKKLVSKVIEVLPNEKKYSFSREAKEENVTEESREKAEKGIFDHIKEKIGEAWDYVKDDVIDYLAEKAIEHIPKIAEKAVDWFKSWFKKT